MGLQATIEELWERGEVAAEPIEEAIDLLDRGELRVAEPGPDGWVVNEWAKKAILLYFRLRKVELSASKRQQAASRRARARD